MSVKQLRLGHSPDPDDAFMFYALARHRIDTRGYEFEHILKDIETLNHWAMEGRLEISAVSVHAFAYVCDKYALLPSGASMGDGYGPVIVARHRMSFQDLRSATIAIPGEKTTAFLALRLCMAESASQAADLYYEVVPFDQILSEVSEGRVEAGLLIHEGQLTYASLGLHKVLDLGEWWQKMTGLPLPLGCNVARKDLGTEALGDIAAILDASIRYGLDHRDEAIAYALQWARHTDATLADRFIAMYVNASTLDYGEEGRRAVELLLRKGQERGFVPGPVQIEFVPTANVSLETERKRCIGKLSRV